MRAGTILGSIARQLASHLPPEAFPESSLPITDELALLEFLGTLLGRGFQCTIILDGLDECEEAQIREVANLCRKLIDYSLQQRLRIFWSTRSNVPSWLRQKLLPKQHIYLDTVESQHHIASDIREFVDITLQDWLSGDAPEMQISNPDLILTIVDQLEQKANGMQVTAKESTRALGLCSTQRFLWVKFQLLTVQEKKTDSQILDTLNHLPRDLPETFSTVLSKFTDHDDINVRHRIFLWTAVAKRPLNIEELQQAIAIKPLQQDLDPGCIINNMKKAIACYGNLIFIDEEMHTVHFTHSSVPQYLSSHTIPKSPSDHQIDHKEANAIVGAICVTYLNFAMFKAQLARTQRANFQPSVIASVVARDTLPAKRRASRAALRLLRGRDKSSIATQGLIDSATIDPEGHRRSEIQDKHSFLHYAQSFWLEHTAHGFRQDREKLQRLLLQLLNDAEHRNILPDISWKFDDWSNRTLALIAWIVEYDHCLLAELVLSSELRLDELMQELLLRGAAFNGSVRVLEVCLAQENIPSSVLELSLCNAAQGGHLVIVERLLQAGVKVNTDTPHFERTVLPKAVSEGYPPLIERLTKAEAGLNAPGTYDMTPLQAAISKGHLNVIGRLLQAGAELKVVADSATALRKAADKGHLPVIERLLQAGAEVNAATSNMTAIQEAAQSGNLEVVERLLQAGANVNAIAPGAWSSRGWTALQAAAKWSHLDLVERLLQAGAEVNAAPVGEFGTTALQAAVGRGNLQMVER